MPLNASQTQPPIKRPGLYTLAVVLLLAGGAAIFFNRGNFIVEALGLLAILGSVRLVKAARSHPKPAVILRKESHAESAAPVKEWDTRKPTPPGRVAWSICIATLIATIASYYVMYDDALHGGHTGWPAYLFGAAAMALAISSGYIVARYVQS